MFLHLDIWCHVTEPLCVLVVYQILKLFSLLVQHQLASCEFIVLFN